MICFKNFLEVVSCAPFLNHHGGGSYFMYFFFAFTANNNLNVSLFSDTPIYPVRKLLSHLSPSYIFIINARNTCVTYEREKENIFIFISNYAIYLSKSIRKSIDGIKSKKKNVRIKLRN